MGTWRAGVLLGCFLRSYFITAGYNPQGLQNIGFLYAIEPALSALYGPGERLAAARMRYARHYNCHPFFTPMLLGVFLRFEMAIACNHLDASVLENLKSTTANTLSAIGDSLFNGTLLATWALASSCLMLAGQPLVALWMTVFCVVLLQLFKLAIFMIGFKKGMAVFFFLRKVDLINRGDSLKYVNAVLLGLFLWLALPEAPVLAWGGVAMYLLAAGWIVGKLHLSRVLVALVLLAVTVALHKAGLFGEIPTFLFMI